MVAFKAIQDAKKRNNKYTNKYDYSRWQKYNLNNQQYSR